MAEEKKSDYGWWQTVPGVLTAVAAFVSAMAALIIALHQVGIFGGEEIGSSTVESKPSPNPPREAEKFVDPLPGTTSKGSILDEIINAKQSVKAIKPLTKEEVFSILAEQFQKTSNDHGEVQRAWLTTVFAGDRPFQQRLWGFLKQNYGVGNPMTMGGEGEQTGYAYDVLQAISTTTCILSQPNNDKACSKKDLEYELQMLKFHARDDYPKVKAFLDECATFAQGLPTRKRAYIQG